MATLSELAKRIPFAVQIVRCLRAPARMALKRRVLAGLESAHNPKGTPLAQALRSLGHALPEADRDWLVRIEAEREKLASNSDPLDDGTLGEAGLYDKDLSIAGATAVSKPPRPALLLYLLTRSLRPGNVIELGTNVGISSAFIGAALTVNGDSGRLNTLDASPYRQRLASQMHARLGLQNIAYTSGLFNDTLESVLQRIGKVDLAFIDGHHQYQPTLDYLDSIMQHATVDCTFVFDDIRWSDGMTSAWTEIVADARFSLVLDLGEIGVCVRGGESSGRFVSEQLSSL